MESSENRSSLAFVIAAFVYVPVILAANVSFYRRRHLQPIKSRAPLLAIMSSIVVLLWQLMDTIIFHWSDSISCVAGSFSGQFVLPLNLSVFLVRAIWLYATYNHVIEQRTLLQLTRDEGFDTAISTTICTPKKGKVLRKFDKLKSDCFPKWRWENAHKSSFISMFLSTLSFLHLLQFIISVLVIPNAFEESLEECDNSRTEILGVSVAIFYIVCIIVVSFKLRVVIEGVGIKSELRTVGLLSLFSVFVWILGSTISSLNDFTRNTFPIVRLIVNLNSLATQVAMIFVPLYRSWALEKRSLAMESLWLNSESLTSILQTENGFGAFYDFLTGEFSVENIIFYQNTLDFKNRFDVLKNHKLRPATKAAIECDIYNHALYVFDTHLARNAELEVNLPGILVDQITSRLRVPRKGITPSFLDSKVRGTTASLNPSAESNALESALTTGMEGTFSKRKRITDSDIPAYVAKKQLRKFESNVASLEDLYVQAHRTILELMLKDSFRRFIDSKHFRKLNDVFVKNRAINDVLHMLDIL